MAKMDRIIKVKADLYDDQGNPALFETRTWAERTDRPSGATEQDDTPFENPFGTVPFVSDTSRSSPVCPRGGSALQTMTARSGP